MIVEEPKQLPMTRKKSWFEMMEEEEVEYNDEIVVSRHSTAYREKATSASRSDTVSPVSQKRKRAKLSTTLRVFEATYFDETYVHEMSSAAYEWEVRARDMRASAEQQSECYTSIMRIMYAAIMCAVLPKYWQPSSPPSYGRKA